MDYPPVTIVMTTYFPGGELGFTRRDAAKKTLRTWAQDFYYHGDLNLHVADDGSSIDWRLGEKLDWEQISYSQQERKGVGASLNKGFQMAYRSSSPIVFYGVDDWYTTQPVDLTPWVKLLLERTDVGMVRLGPPHPNTRGRIEMFTDDWQGWGLRLDRYAYAYAQRPALYHRRFTDHYGWFKEEVSALDCEREYAEHFVRTPGPDIILALPHPWKHIDTVSMSDMTPGV